MEHFIEKNHDINAFKSAVIDRYQPRKFVRQDIYRKLLKKEMYWIYKLKSYLPYGLNTVLDYSMYI